MKKLKIILILAISFLIFTGCSKPQNPAPANSEKPKGMVLYFRTDCPHCHDVEKFISQYQINSKLEFAQKELSSDQANISEFITVVSFCSIPEAERGVPLFWDGSRCYSGSDEIINFFKAKAGIK